MNARHGRSDGIPLQLKRFEFNRQTMTEQAEATTIPIVVKSGEKVRKPQGFTAIRDGIKARRNSDDVGHVRKPDWLRVRLPSGGKYEQVKANVNKHKLATVCSESKCP
ncbi:MAG TPA: hypothetical protein VKO85_14210, partial [Wenzhouxiangellaceae bacterium]|nr:hypothetical protein [Wenzhouxiangellaceae bacterium]